MFLPAQPLDHVAIAILSFSLSLSICVSIERPRTGSRKTFAGNHYFRKKKTMVSRCFLSEIPTKSYSLDSFLNTLVDVGGFNPPEEYARQLRS